MLSPAKRPRRSPDQLIADIVAPSLRTPAQQARLVTRRLSLCDVFLAFQSWARVPWIADPHTGLNMMRRCHLLRATGILALIVVATSCSEREAAPGVRVGGTVTFYAVPGVPENHRGPWSIEEIQGTRARLVHYISQSMASAATSQRSAPKREAGADSSSTTNPDNSREIVAGKGQEDTTRKPYDVLDQIDIDELRSRPTPPIRVDEHWVDFAKVAEYSVR